MERIRVLIADDHTLFRQSLSSLLNTFDIIEVVGEASTGLETIAKAAELKPDIVLMDIAMPNTNGLQATLKIKRDNPTIKVLVLSQHETSQYIQELLSAGASGYIIKSASADDLVYAIKTIYGGQTYLYPTIANTVVQDYVAKLATEEHEGPVLTAREQEIVALIAEGKSNDDIAKLLVISTTTVQTHRYHLMKKLGIHDRTELTRYAIRKGIIIP